METFINDLVNQYKNNSMTWHDIIDTVSAYVVKLDGEGLSTDWEVLRVRFDKANIILQEIEKRINAKEVQ